MDKDSPKFTEKEKKYIHLDVWDYERDVFITSDVPGWIRSRNSSSSPKKDQLGLKRGGNGAWPHRAEFTGPTGVKIIKDK